MKIKATTPCYKFRDATSEAQIAKIKEELAEVEAAELQIDMAGSISGLILIQHTARQRKPRYR